MVGYQVNIVKVKEIWTGNRLSSLRKLGVELTVIYMSICILNNHVCMKYVADGLIVKDLNFLQKINRKVIAEDMLERTTNDHRFRFPTFIKCVVIGDET